MFKKHIFLNFSIYLLVYVQVKYYSTKFEPPKKEKKTSQLSDNIKKFLAKKEAEEKKKALEARQKRDELLALRSQVNFLIKLSVATNKTYYFL